MTRFYLGDTGTCLGTCWAFAHEHLPLDQCFCSFSPFAPRTSSAIVLLSLPSFSILGPAFLGYDVVLSLFRSCINVRMKQNSLKQKMLQHRNPSGYTTHTFLSVPLVYALANVLLAILLSLIAPSASNEELREQGLQMSDTILSTSITILALTFSLTFLSIQIAAQTYSPRLLDDFIKDPVSKISIAVNVGAFAYSYTMTFYLHNPHRVPPVSIYFLSVQAIAVVVMFVVFIHYFVNGFRLEKILAKAVVSSWNAARTMERRSLRSATSNEEDVMSVPSSAYKILADSSGYVKRYSLDQILDACAELNVCVQYNPQIGEFVAEGTIIAYAWESDISRSSVADRTRTRRIQRRVLGVSSMGSKWQAEEEFQVEETLGKLVADGISRFHPFDRVNSTFYPWNPTTCGCCSPLNWSQCSTYSCTSNSFSQCPLWTSGIFGLHHTLGSSCQEWHGLRNGFGIICKNAALVESICPRTNFHRSKPCLVRV